MRLSCSTICCACFYRTYEGLKLPFFRFFSSSPGLVFIVPMRD
ncbi:hypothetical protein B4113_1666 [Geobacillus sp. B4113_201601]|nr:hypothetical protein B4113_1666 [Geobacillus sp. B4113_201601]